MADMNVHDAEMVQQACRHPHMGVLSYAAATQWTAHPHMEACTLIALSLHHQ